MLTVAWWMFPSPGPPELSGPNGGAHRESGIWSGEFGDLFSVCVERACDWERQKYNPAECNEDTFLGVCAEIAQNNNIAVSICARTPWLIAFVLSFPFLLLSQ